MVEIEQGNKESNQLSARVAEHATKEAKDAARLLSTLASTYDPESLLAACFVLMLSARGEASELTHGDVPAKLERLAYYLWSCPTPGDKAPTTEAVASAVEAASNLLSHTMLSQVFDPARWKDPVEGLLLHLSIDAQVVRGSAYPEQTSEEIRQIAGRFDNWFRSNIRATATELVQILWSVGWTGYVAVNEWLSRFSGGRGPRKKRHHRRRHTAGNTRHTEESSPHQRFSSKELERIAAEARQVVPVDREACELPDGSRPRPPAWDALISLIGLTRQCALEGKDFYVARRKPLIVLSDHRVLLPGLPNALDSLWEGLESFARVDPSLYARFQQTKADWLEERAVEYLQRVFGEKAVYRNLSYPDPDKPGEHANTELDVAVHWGPFLVLAEVKAKQFRLEGQLGDVGRLRSDLKANVDDAFQQARRARTYLASVAEAHFREVGTGRELCLRRDQLRRVYLVTVSLHLLGNAINRLANLRTLGLLEEEDYPWAVSLADLDIITRFVEGPDVFLHYLERRREVEREILFPLNDEIDLFGAYLHTRLHPSALPVPAGCYDQVWLTGFQIPFDEWVEWQRGTRKQPPEIKLKIPEAIRIVLRELRRRADDDAARWIAFALLALSENQLEALARALADIRRQVPIVGEFRRLVLSVEDMAISITVTADRPVEELRRRTGLRAAVEKYRRKVSRSIGFGIHLGQDEAPFDCCTWIDEPWAPDPRMEALIEREPPFFPAPGQKLPGRNAPCFCGSGRKFKKCCLAKMGTGRTNHW